MRTGGRIVNPPVRLVSGFGQRLGLVDQHHRDAVADGKQQAAVPADDPVPGRVQFHWPLALRAGQNVQQFFFDHRLVPNSLM